MGTWQLIQSSIHQKSNDLFHRQRRKAICSSQWIFGDRHSTAKLKADKPNGVISLDENTQLIGVEAIAWEYKLGNRSALEWILDQYKEKKPKDPTIAKLFNTYKFADYKEQVIDLLQRVCTVSVRTMAIVQQMP
jgi:predicted helicase